MLSPKLLEILREWWRVDKPKGWLFPGDRVGSHTVESVCQNAHRRCYIPKPITPHSLRHYPEFPTIPSRIDVNCSKAFTKAFTGKLWSSIGMQVNSA